MFTRLGQSQRGARIGRELTNLACRASVLAIAGLLAGSASSGFATGWSKPTTVAYEAPGAIAEARLLESPDQARTDLVTVRGRTGIELYPWGSAGAFSRPSRVPGSLHARFPSAAMDARGAVALVWTEALGYRGERGEFCICHVRADVRPAGRRNGPVTALALDSRKSPQDLGVVISKQGRAGVLWSAGSEILFAEATQAGRFGQARTVARGDYRIADEGSRGPEVIYGVERGNETFLSDLYATGPPFAGRAFLGSVDESPVLSINSDARGDVLIVLIEEETGEVQAIYRPAEGRFGKPSVVARLRPGALHQCSLGTAMNARGEALAAWACSPTGDVAGVKGEPDFGQAALLAPGARVAAVSARHAVAVANPPGVAINNGGLGLVAWQDAVHDPYNGLISLDVAHNGFGSYRTLVREPFAVNPLVDLAVTSQGVGLATWIDESRFGTERIRVSSIRLPR
jgi:hypothetical protein